MIQGNIDYDTPLNAMESMHAKGYDHFLSLLKFVDHTNTNCSNKNKNIQLSP